MGQDSATAYVFLSLALFDCASNVDGSNRGKSSVFLLLLRGAQQNLGQIQPCCCQPETDSHDLTSYFRAGFALSAHYSLSLSQSHYSSRPFTSWNSLSRTAPAKLHLASYRPPYRRRESRRDGGSSSSQVVRILFHWWRAPRTS